MPFEEPSEAHLKPLQAKKKTVQAIWRKVADRDWRTVSKKSEAEDKA